MMSQVQQGIAADGRAEMMAGSTFLHADEAWIEVVQLPIGEDQLLLVHEKPPYLA